MELSHTSRIFAQQKIKTSLKQSSIISTFLLSITLLSAQKYLGIIFVALFKYLLAIFLAWVADYALWEILVFIYLPSSISLIVFAYFGQTISRQLAKRFKRRKPMKFSTRRRVIKVWRKYGLLGIAFLSPFISPPIAVAIALSFRTQPRKIIAYLCVSLFLWSLVLANFRDVLRPLFVD